MTKRKSGVGSEEMRYALEDITFKQLSQTIESLIEETKLQRGRIGVLEARVASLEENSRE